ncbi:MAG: hypothetical protein JNL19_10625 [Burkholderiales bacterium]|nr:hypothetical protein [Burkholderiales bacterium]
MFHLVFRQPPISTAIAVLALTALAGCASMPEPAVKRATEPSSAAPTKSVLWVGNSFFYYNNSMHGHVGHLIRGSAMVDKRGFRGVSATISGSGLNWHDVEAHFKPGGVGSYSFDGNNNVVFNKFDKPFDVVMMMDCSQCPIHPQLRPLFYDAVKKNSEIVRRHGARPALFMSWAYSDKPEMTEQLAAEYIAAGRAHQAQVVPAGLAFAASIKARPDINLYTSDKRHPSMAGTYLAACTVLASIYGASPVGNSYTADLPPETARFLQGVAWETVQQFASRK